jgi:hypothetical protein
VLGKIDIRQKSMHITETFARGIRDAETVATEQDMVFKRNESIFGHILSALGVILIFPEHLNARIRLPAHVELREFSRVQQKLRVLLLIVQRDPEGSATLVRTASCER